MGPKIVCPKIIPITGENAYGRKYRNLLCHLEAEWKVVLSMSVIARGHMDFETNWIFRKLIKLMNSLSMYKTKIKLQNFSVQNVVLIARTKNKNMCSALAHIFLLICPICLFIQFSFFLVDNLISNCGQQFISRWTTICFPVHGCHFVNVL